MKTITPRFSPLSFLNCAVFSSLEKIYEMKCTSVSNRHSILFAQFNKNQSPYLCPIDTDTAFPCDRVCGFYEYSKFERGF